MKVKVELGALVDQIEQAAITIDHKSDDLPRSKVYQRPVIRKDVEGKSIPAFYLFSTDQSSKTFIRIDVDSVDGEGEILIDPAKVLGGLANRDRKQMVEMEVLNGESNKVRMKIGRNVVHFQYDDKTKEAHDTIEDMGKTVNPKRPLAKIPAKTLIQLINRSRFCVLARDNGQQTYAMGALNLKGGDGFYTAEATDGYIVSIHKAKQQTEDTTCNLESLLIPVEALAPLYKLLQSHKDEDIDILAGKLGPNKRVEEVFFTMDKVWFGTTMRAGRCSPIQKMLNGHTPLFEVEVSKEELKGSLNRASNFVENDKDKHTAKLTVTETSLKVEASNNQSDISDELDIKVVKGKVVRVEVLVSISYLLNICDVTTNRGITLGFSTEKSKALSIKDTSEDGIDTLYAVMQVIPKVDTDAKKPRHKVTKEDT